MNTHADKSQENKSQAVANSLPKLQSESESTFQFVDNRPEAIAQRKLQEAINNSPRVQPLKAYQEMANNSPQVKQLRASQLMADNFTSKPVQQEENNTGLPDNLKSGIENLSGYSMDDVKVHYNSDKPAQLQAHAYAQGTDIHLASGQEKHLPHEAWHVVQQKQGRVQPTVQMKSGVSVNDDKELEKEADNMGEQVQKQLVSSQVEKQKLTSIDPTKIIQGQWWRSFFRKFPKQEFAKYKTIDTIDPIYRVDKRPPSEILKTGFQARVLRFPMENITTKDVAKYQISNSKNPGIVSTSDSLSAVKDFAKKVPSGTSDKFYAYKISPKGLIEFPLNDNIPILQRFFYSEQEERMIVAGIEPERIEFIEEVDKSAPSEMSGLE